MVSAIRQPTSGNRTVAGTVFLAAMLFGAAMFAIALWRMTFVSCAGLTYGAICRELLNNTREGRQALICSAWWPPLPALFGVPFAPLDAIMGSPVAPLLVGALMGGATLYVFERTLSDCNLGWPRFVMVLALAMNPFFLESCTNGSPSTAVMFFVVLVAHSLVQWMTTRMVRFLVHLGIGSAMLLATNFEMGFWLLPVMALLIADMLTCESTPYAKEAVIMLTLLPTVYTLAVWFLMNRLIMGDALYFLRSFISTLHTPAAFSGASISTAHYITCWVSMVALVVAILRKNRAGIFMGTLAVTPILLAMFLESRHALLSSAPVLQCMFPLAVLAVAHCLETEGEVSHSRGAFVSLVPVALTALTIALNHGMVACSPETRDVVSLRGMQDQVLTPVERYVIAKSRYSKVFVCGYDSLLIGHRNKAPVFISVLDFDLEKAKKEYRGYDLYVLVRRPVGRSAQDSIHWKYDRIYNFGAQGALYDSDWGDWRLFEIIQAR
jgi:hypothetical protein